MGGAGWLAVLAALPVALFAAYLLAGYLGVPYLARTRLQSFVRTHYGRNLAVRDIQFNPLTFRMEASGVALPDADGKPMLSFEHLRAQPSLASLWRMAPSFREIVLEQPQAHVVVRHDGSLNLADLTTGLDHTSGQRASKPLQLSIERLRVLGGSGSFEDRTIPGPFIQHLLPVNFELRDFSTRSAAAGGAANVYALTATSTQGTNLKWNGSFTLQPLASRGTLELTGLPLRTVWAYARSPLPIAPPPGHVALQGTYDAALKGRALALKLLVPQMTVTGLKLRPGKASTDYVELPRIAVSNTRVDLEQHSVDIGQVVEEGGSIEAWLAKGAHVNLLEMLPARVAASTSSPAGPAATPAARPHGKHRRAAAAGHMGRMGAAPDANAGTLGGWHVKAPDIELRHLKIAAEDRQVTPAVPFAVDPLDVKVTGYSSAPGSELDVSMDATVNGGKLALKGQFNPDTHAATATVNLAGLELRGLQPYLATETGMILLSGNLGTHLGVERSADGVLTLKGNAELKDVRTVDDQARQDFIRWQDMQINELQYASQPQRLQVGTVTVHAPYARVIVFPNLTTNVSEILTPSRQLHGRPRQETAPEENPQSGPAQGAHQADEMSIPVASSAALPSDSGPAATQDKSAQPAPRASGKDSNAARTEQASTEQASTEKGSTEKGSTEKGSTEQQQHDKAAAAPEHSKDSQDHKDASAAAPAQPASGAPAEAPKDTHKDSSSTSGGGQTGTTPPLKPLVSFPATIKSVQVIDGSANYADYWIQPHFAVGIQTLNGTVSGISSDPQSRAQIDLEGKVDRYAPAHIGGEMNLLSAFTYSDVRMSFKGVDMTSVTPYSGHFAGYKIDKGKMSLDLNYKIENRQLKAQQHFVINQLQLGEKVDSKAAVKLPVKLAVALLKDKNGVIDIGLPMTGSLDDPHFKIGPLIWKAFMNLLGKIVTAPFALLGHLFGGGETMNVVEFAPGSATLTPEATKKLGSVIKILNERPALQLEIPAAYADRDRQGLAELRIWQGQKPHSPKASAGPSAQNGKDNDDSVLASPARRFRLLVGAYRSTAQGADLPESVLDANGAGGSDPATLGPAIAELEAAVLPHFPVTDSDLEQLGARRAQAVEDALVAGGIDPQRLFVLKEHHAGAGVKGGAGPGQESASPEKDATGDEAAGKDTTGKDTTGSSQNSPENKDSKDVPDNNKENKSNKVQASHKATLDKVAVELSLD